MAAARGRSALRSYAVFLSWLKRWLKLWLKRGRLRLRLSALRLRLKLSAPRGVAVGRV